MPLEPEQKTMVFVDRKNRNVYQIPYEKLYELVSQHGSHKLRSFEEFVEWLYSNEKEEPFHRYSKSAQVLLAISTALETLLQQDASTLQQYLLAKVDWFLF